MGRGFPVLRYMFPQIAILLILILLLYFILI